MTLTSLSGDLTSCRFSGKKFFKIVNEYIVVDNIISPFTGIGHKVLTRTSPGFSSACPLNAVVHPSTGQISSIDPRV